MHAGGRGTEPGVRRGGWWSMPRSALFLRAQRAMALLAAQPLLPGAQPRNVARDCSEGIRAHLSGDQPTQPGAQPPLARQPLSMHPPSRHTGHSLPIQAGEGLRSGTRYAPNRHSARHPTPSKMGLHSAPATQPSTISRRRPNHRPGPLLSSRASTAAVYSRADRTGATTDTTKVVWPKGCRASSLHGAS